MKINLEKYKKYHWFEDKEGNVYDAVGVEPLPDDKDYFIYHVIESCVYSETLIEYSYHPKHLHEDNSFYQAMLHFKWFRNYMFRKMKKRKDQMTFLDIATFNTTFNAGSDCIVAMVNSGDYTLGEAIYVYCHSCERCENVLERKYLGEEYGYEEYSEQWKNCNTECEWCKDAVID